MFIKDFNPEISVTSGVQLGGFQFLNMVMPASDFVMIMFTSGKNLVKAPEFAKKDNLVIFRKYCVVCCF